MALTVSLLGFLSDETYDRLRLTGSPKRPYRLKRCLTRGEFLAMLQHGEGIDALVLEEGPELQHLIGGLRQRSLLFPTLIVSKIAENAPALEHYHPAEIYFALEPEAAAKEPEAAALKPESEAQPPLQARRADSLAGEQIPNPRSKIEVELQPQPLSERFSQAIDQCLQQFMALSPKELLDERQTHPSETSDFLHRAPIALQDQQQELKNRLQERLDYLGVYYKRDPQHFLRNLSAEDQAEIVSSLRSQYQAIVLTYFSEGAELNALIDEFVNTAFFTDVPVTKIVEIHMELMDAYAKQLKLEGRSEEILVDYRLTLLDVISHLCEMYRRSIPRES